MLAYTLRLQKTRINFLENFLTNVISIDSMREALGSVAQQAYRQGTQGWFFFMNRQSL